MGWLGFWYSVTCCLLGFVCWSVAIVFILLFCDSCDFNSVASWFNDASFRYACLLFWLNYLICCWISVLMELNLFVIVAIWLCCCLLLCCAGLLLCLFLFWTKVYVDFGKVLCWSLVGWDWLFCLDSCLICFGCLDCLVCDVKLFAF